MKNRFDTIGYRLRKTTVPDLEQVVEPIFNFLRRFQMSSLAIGEKCADAWFFIQGRGTEEQPQQLGLWDLLRGECSVWYSYATSSQDEPVEFYFYPRKHLLWARYWPRYDSTVSHLQPLSTRNASWRRFVFQRRWLLCAHKFVCSHRSFPGC